MAHCKHVQATDSYVTRFQPEVLTLDLDWKLTKDNKKFSCKGDIYCVLEAYFFMKWVELATEVKF